MVHEVRHVLLAFSQGHYLPGSLMNMQTSIPFVDSALLLGKTWKSDELCDRGIGLPARYSRVLAELPWLIYCLCSPTSAPCSCMHVYSVQVHEKLRQAPIFTCNLQKPWHSFLRWYSVKYFQNNWRGQTNLSQISYQQHVRDYKLDPDPRQIWFTTMHQLQVVRTALGCPKKGGKNPILKTGTGFSLSVWGPRERKQAHPRPLRPWPACQRCEGVRGLVREVLGPGFGDWWIKFPSNKSMERWQANWRKRVKSWRHPNCHRF